MKRTFLRTFGGLILFLFLAGPTPGNIGGCGSQNAIASAPQHCTDEEFWKCRRDQYAGRISNEQFAQCQVEIPTLCEGATWPAGCAPTPAQSEACITLVSRADLAVLTYAELRMMYTECNLCP